MTTPPGGTLAEGVLVQAMWTYAAAVLRPVQLARRHGLAPQPAHAGTLPLVSDRPGLGPRFAREHPRPRLKEAPSTHDHLVEEFDRMGEVYDAYVRPFSEPIMDEAMAFLGRYLRPDMRLLDAGCGAGREVCRMAALVPQGEVVGIDLAAGMVVAAHRAARAKGLDNTAFVQADIGALPEAFDGAFDLVYSSLAHHHYPDAPAATRAVFRALRPGGLYAVIDAGPAWFNRTAGPLAAWADPGWIGFHTPDAFDRLFAEAGFTCRAWIDLLPGFGIALGQKPPAA
ncbi:MAG: class I SAM-dependent methyltransferase [Rhodospirillaceae bacterium]|nr:class I SAM-dependent methyltransferase [Rhodospirillaceae bacterium]